MNEETDKLLLDELRSINAQIKKANRISTVAMTVLGVFFVLFLATIPFRQQIVAHLKSAAQTADSWHEARSLLDQGEDQKGKEMLERLVRKYPEYYWGHVLMGFFYQKSGNLEASEKSYARAAELFPDEDNEKTLVAIRKAIQQRKETANQASDAARKPADPQR